ncbi:hypothetical protein BH23VER1_BH23VER1_06400 [soil metagenome]
MSTFPTAEILTSRPDRVRGQEDELTQAVAAPPAPPAPPAPKATPKGEGTDPSGAGHFMNGDGKAGPSAIEKIAARSGLLPVELPRKACSIPAEALLRKLGRMVSSHEPWLPVGSVGPILTFAHYRPEASEDFWGVAPFLRVGMVITEEDYHTIQHDLGERLNYKPLPADNPVEGRISPPPEGTDFRSILDWFISTYPFSDDERQKMERLAQENASKPLQSIENLGFLPRHYPAAMMHWLTGDPCYNPEEAPGQDFFPDALLEKHGVFPLFCGAEKIYLLTSKRSNYAFEDEWLSMGHEPVEMVAVISDPGAINNAITRNRSRNSRASATATEVGELYYSENHSLVDIEPQEVARTNPQNPNNTPEQIIHWILNRAITLRASDLHVERFYNMIRFRARIDGELHTIHSASEEDAARYIALFKNFSNMGQQRQDLQDARFAMKIGKRRIDVRVSAVPCRKENQKLTMRFLDKQDGVKSLTELNLSDRQSRIIRETMSRDQGLVLVTGPTGSGKTTTLYAFLNSINEEGINIHTIEDPIEYEIEGINQTQTDPFYGIDFPNGLRALLRADPDVMLIGESRDEETANAAINAALTGHLVLTTLHANDSLRAVSRLLSMGIAPYLLADALAMSQAQRLVRRLCAYCKHPKPMAPEIQQYLHRQGVLHQPTDEPIYEAVGCDECHGTGFTGRIALMEMCPVGPELGDLIARGAPMSEMRALATRDGVLTLYQEGLTQVMQGHTTFDEIKGLSYTAI